MRRIAACFLLISVLGGPSLTYSETVTFEPIVAAQGDQGFFTTNRFGSSFDTEGFRFQMGQDALDFVSLGGAAFCGPPCPYNGTNFLLIQDSGNFAAVTISRPDGSEFSVQSFDAAESFVGTSFEARWITATGITALGRIVTQRFRLNKINDGVGARIDFQTFKVAAKFKRLLWFGLNGTGGFYDESNNGFARNDFSVDNIVVNEK